MLAYLINCDTGHLKDTNLPPSLSLHLPVSADWQPSIIEGPRFARLTAKLIRSMSAYLHAIWTNP